MADHFMYVENCEFQPATGETATPQQGRVRITFACTVRDCPCCGRKVATFDSTEPGWQQKIENALSGRILRMEIEE